ncbi:hypothetical protein GCM10027275_52490 [Rhabdobacter roseus]|uniref:histidine kinase n=1 Tax=Rhabdobacter roseus TaxID=1655419 RepID=A0A840TVQ3_9BACT|nr:PAS domain S-box protein [Rhabdobacter roseus]MBB5287324.1 PAS domain S-box-containing protein [Rhabdobacter roseus]
MASIDLWQRRWEEERTARLEAEKRLERKASELFEANEQLRTLNEQLKRKINERAEALRDSELRYRQLIESASDIIYRLDENGLLTYVNPIGLEKFGYNPEESMGRLFVDFIHPEHKEEVISFYNQVRETQQERSYFEFKAIAGNGEELWLGQNLQLIFSNGPERKILEYIAVARDITARRAAERELQTTQLRLSSLITNLHAGVLVEDQNRHIVLVNQNFCNLFDPSLRPNQLVGLHFSQFIEKYQHFFAGESTFTSRIEALISQKEPVINETVEMVDGRYLERNYIPIFSAGAYLGHLWQYTDVTDRNQSEALIRRSEEKYRGIIENMELGLLEVDNEDRITKVYDRFCKMVGYEASELLGKKAAALFMPPNYLDLMDMQHQKRQQGESSTYEVPMRKKNGDTIWVLISGAPIFDEEGKVEGSIGMHYDITYRKQLEDDLALAKQVAEASQEAEKQFLANMSHEIRTPLNAIVGMANLLYDTSPNPQQLEYLDILKVSSNFLLSLISDLLDMAKIEAGRVEVNSRPFDLLGTLRTMQKTFQLKVEGEGRPVSVEFESNSCPEGMVLGDEMLLTQILLNLLGNADKFTERGAFGLRVREVERRGESTLLEFQVYDSGKGIPEEKLDLIFQKFQQVNDSSRQKHQGTGLGLAIVKQLILLQGGEIKVQSRLRQGTTFTFTLPYRLLHEPARSTQKTDVSLKTNGQGTLEGYRILVVEDNLLNQKYISTLLSKWKVNFQLAKDGREAVEMAQKKAYQLILMDIQMPIMNGYESTIAIRSTSNPNQQTPIVALTASAMLDQRNMALTSGMNDFLSKPFTPTQLEEKLKEFLHYD